MPDTQTTKTNPLVKAISNLSDTTLTENGGLTYSDKSIENPFVQIFYAVSSFRQRHTVNESLKKRAVRLNNIDDDPLIKVFDSVIKEAKDSPEVASYATRLALLIRDIAEGMGERALGRVLLKKLTDHKLVNINQLVDVLVNKGIGRWDDVVYLLCNTSNIEAKTILTNTALKQLDDDWTKLSTDKEQANISLLAKWMPSISTSSSQTRRQALYFIKLLKTDNRSYRKMLSAMRRHLDIVEQKVSSQRWKEIDYAKVPSQASLKYASQFHEHDGERYREFLDSVEKGTAKINAGTLSAGQVIAKLRNDLDEDNVRVCELLWQSLQKLPVEGNFLPVSDISGSMTWNKVGGITPLDVSIGLGFYLAENNTGVFKDLMLSFSEKTKVIDLKHCQTLKARLHKLDKFVGYNTNIEQLLEHLFVLCKRNKVAQEDIPTLIIFSDMEFDQANEGKEAEPVFETYKHRFAEIGLTLPPVIFWNLCNRSGSVPLKTNAAGMMLCSGFSQQMMRCIVSRQYDRLDSWLMLKERLDSPRYKDNDLTCNHPK